MNEENFKEILNQKQQNGKITCKDACDAADQNNIPRAVVGKILNEMGIKIKACQLGCFT